MQSSFFFLVDGFSDLIWETLRRKMNLRSLKWTVWGRTPSPLRTMAANPDLLDRQPHHPHHRLDGKNGSLMEIVPIKWHQLIIFKECIKVPNQIFVLMLSRILYFFFELRKNATYEYLICLRQFTTKRNTYRTSQSYHQNLPELCSKE